MFVEGKKESLKKLYLILNQGMLAVFLVDFIVVYSGLLFL